MNTPKWVNDKANCDDHVQSAWKLKAYNCTLEVWSFDRRQWHGKLRYEDAFDGELFELGPTKAAAQRQVIDAALRDLEILVAQLKAARP